MTSFSEIKSNVLENELSKKVWSSFIEKATSEYLKRRICNSDVGKITVGVEIEIFLKNGLRFANLEESQYFLSHLSREKGWAVFDKKNDKIGSVSFECGNGRYHSVKYEHPPHFIELAVAPTNTPSELESVLKFCFDALRSASLHSKISLHIVPEIEPPELNWSEIGSLDKRYFDLADSRSALVPESFRNEKWVHFSTYTAATQFHFGGIRWWEDTDLINRLYLLEPLSSYHAQSLLSEDIVYSKRAFQSRKKSYDQVFKNFKLVNFPEFNQWSSENWIECLLDSSLTYSQKDPFYKKTLRQLVMNDKDHSLSIEEAILLLPKIRDLQIIKPKQIGTIEFRSDPALPDENKIFKQSLFRASVFNVARNKSFNIPYLYRDARAYWSASTIPVQFEEFYHELKFKKRSHWDDV